MNTKSTRVEFNGTCIATGERDNVWAGLTGEILKRAASCNIAGYDVLVEIDAPVSVVVKRLGGDDYAQRIANDMLNERGRIEVEANMEDELSVICPNCEQRAHRPGTRSDRGRRVAVRFYDCINDCAARGFAARVPVSVKRNVGTCDDCGRQNVQLVGGTPAGDKLCARCSC